jgi:tetratricopeptide (TPR) repeat protein
MKVNPRRSLRIELASCVLLLTTCAACTAGEQPAKQTLDEAIQTNMDKLLADKDYDEVIKRANDVFEKSERFEREQGASGRMKDSTRCLLLSYRSLAWMNKDEFEIASRDLSELLKLMPKYGWAHMHLGRCYLKKRDYDNAVRSLTEAIRWDPKDEDAYYFRACARWEKNGKQLNDSVRADYRKAHELTPESYPPAQDDELPTLLSFQCPTKAVED